MDEFLIIFHPLAERELVEAYDWYEEKLQGLGNRFIDAVDMKMRKIALNPLLYSRKAADFREALIDTFPYLIVYNVFDKEQAIFISSIYHTSRIPQDKYRRTSL